MNIFVSNLSFGINDNDLNELFAEYGVVSSAKVITDKFTGRSKGFAFVEMPSDDEGKTAIEELNQAEYDGKVINVAVARPKTDRPKRDFGNRGGGGGYKGGSGGGNRGGGGYSSDRRPSEKRW